MFRKKIVFVSAETDQVLFVIKLPKKLVKQAKSVAKARGERLEDLIIRAVLNTVKNI